MSWKKLSCRVTQVGLISLSSLLSLSFLRVSPAIEFISPDESSFEELGMEPEEVQNFIQPGQTNHRRQTAGTKRCPSDANLVVLVPSNLSGLTTQSDPAFFFYFIKYNQELTENNLWIRFSLQDNLEQQEIYQTVIQVKLEKQGISSVTLLEEKQLLTLDVYKTYTWKFQIFSDEDPVGSYVQGLITRVQLPADVISQLEKASPLQQVSIYAQRGIWFDALATLAELRRQDPHNPTLVAKWNELLTSVGLENNVSSAPLILEANSNTFMPVKCL